MSGRTHSDETKIIMSDTKKGENNPMFGQNLSEETRKKYHRLHPKGGMLRSRRVSTKSRRSKDPLNK